MKSAISCGGFHPKCHKRVHKRARNREGARESTGPVRETVNEPTHQAENMLDLVPGSTGGYGQTRLKLSVKDFTRRWKESVDSTIELFISRAPIIQISGKESTSHQQLLVKMSKGELRSVDRSQQAESQRAFRGRSTWRRKHRV
ncbi:hypothetical protein Q5P01_009358 [Channa striata]|uniref:Uncharacterized protein n=1 Tax=Channa striata TaxID=64152 RepID=A0AA88N469_CHASR|nr:hypothetical protein Q5P01_009358 [Channa striata]